MGTIKSTTSNQYDLSQSDLYQLFAYRMKYLDGKGGMALIYPRHARFDAPLPPFDYSPTLRL
ncbi:5-methylcytosine restriction system specificity protein McrC [Rhodocyclaceae bacterium SMB388]